MMTYLLSSAKDARFAHATTIKDKIFQTNSDAFYKAEGLARTVILYGEMFDLRDVDKTMEQLSKELAQYSDFSDLLNAAEYFIGRYIVISYTVDEGIRIVGDTTGTIPVYYTVNNGQEACASHAYFLSQLYELPFSELAQSIREQAMEQQQPLPYDLTMIENVNVLLPNHYLDLAYGQSVRYYPHADLPTRTVQEAVDETTRVMTPFIDILYHRHNIAIGMTAGLDSRVVLSLFKDKKDIPLYTYVHENFNKETPDVYIPMMISDKFDLPYHLLVRRTLSEGVLQKIAPLLSGDINQRILENAFTFRTSELKDRYFITGDIIPLAKSNFGQNLPERKATVSYFVTKSHNYSKVNRRLIGEWFKDVKKGAQSNVSIYDLFFWESRWGRWFTKNVANYEVFTNPLYIFNSRYLINLWLSVPRKYRAQKLIHRGIIQKNWPELLDIPVNPNQSRLAKIADNQWIYYYGSFFKHYVKKYCK
ncbi:MAG: hypothetical protein MR008_05665 [Aerococcus sp.]|nr:hypothetical protein [Aerococcus sp.]